MFQANPMTSARKPHPLTTAVAAGTDARVGSRRSSKAAWLPDMARAIAGIGPFGAILLHDRDVSR